jgi:hypothetical protein
MLRSQTTVARAGFDGIAVKPSECSLEEIGALSTDLVAIDYEGRELFPSPERLDALASDRTVLVTAPVRATGFDPLGDDSELAALSPRLRRVFVAGNPAYLSPAERRRAIAPRLAAGLESRPDAWVGTEGIERIAQATGAPQYDLLSARSEGEVAALRTAGFTGDIALYAPTVISDDDDTLLDALGAYVARRGPVAAAIPDDAPVDARATGATRERLLDAIEDYAIVGTERAVERRIEDLRDAGASTIIGYPARGLDHGRE